MLLLGQDKFSTVDIRIRVKGGGYTAQIYAIRQAIAKALVAYYQKVRFLVTGCGRDLGRGEGLWARG